MRVLLLGPFEVRDDDDRPIEVAGTRLRALVARLAMEPGRIVAADVLVTAIWDEKPPASGTNALQALVTRLRRVIGAGLVEGVAPGYRLAVDASDVDVVRFEQLVSAGRETADPAMLWEAEALWRGPALVDLLDLRFAADAAVRLEDLRLSATEARLALGLAAGEDVLGELRPLAAAHPLAERLQALLMRALYASGRQAEALEAYEQTQRRLADELGIDPSAELTKLHLSILRQDPHLITLQRKRRTNLRAQVTSFVGRDEDVAALAAALTAARLVTVVGPGGAGKTRLASEVAARATGIDGVWFVELAGLTNPNDIASAVLMAIGAREATGDAASRLLEFLGAQRVLLILDNCEHLVAAVADLVHQLLGSCPELRILATSRESLAVGGERLYPIGPLPWPADESNEDPAVYPAVQLFVERATAVRPDFTLDETNAKAVIEICRRLDGMPLAIELAAARTRALGVERIATRLDDRFTLLSSGNRTAMPHHRTLRAVIEWSWALLSEQERELAMRLAVFPAGATLEALDDSNLDDLAGLVDKSLVEHNGDRYRMLETIRSYGVERLDETGRGQAVREDHARYFLRFAEAADADLRTAAQLTAIARLTAEHENILAALRFAVDTQDIDLGIRLLTSMYWYWDLRGSRTTWQHWITAVLGIPGEAPATHQAVISVLYGLMWFEQGAIEDGERAVARGITLSNRPGVMDESPGRTLLLIAPSFLQGEILERPLTALTAWERGITLLLSVYTDDGTSDSLFERLEQAKREFETLGERVGLATTLRALSDHHQRRGELQAAVEAITQAVKPVKELGVGGDHAEVLAELATALGRTGELDQAQAVMREAWELAVEGREAHTIAYIQLVRAELQIRCGNREAARLDLDAAEAGLARTLNQTRARMLCAGFRAMIAILEDDSSAARSVLDTMVAQGLDGAVMPDLAVVAHMYAAVAVHDGSPERAAYLIGVATSLLGTEDRRGYDNLMRPAERARELLGAQAYSAAYDRGAALTRDAAIEAVRSG